MSSIPLPQADVLHGFYLTRCCRLRTDRPHLVCSLHRQYLSNLAQVQLLKSSVVEVNAVYLQLNGEITLLEKTETRNANCFAIHTDGDPTQNVFDLAAAPSPPNGSSSSATGPRCVNGQLARPEPPSDDAPSTACNSS